MKGFIYLIEVAIAAVLIFFTFAMIFSFGISSEKTERFDAVSLSDQLNTLEPYQLAYNASALRAAIPQKYNFSVSVDGLPNETIRVACLKSLALDCQNLKQWLNPIYINNRTINFEITNIAGTSDIFNYDVLVTFKNNSDTQTDPNIARYLAEDRPLVAITKPSSSMLGNFSLQISDIAYEGCSCAGSSASCIHFFVIYNKTNEINDFSKYFYGIGFFINTSETKTWQYVYVRNYSVGLGKYYDFNYTINVSLSNNKVNISANSTSLGGQPLPFDDCCYPNNYSSSNLNEGAFFNLFYMNYMIKKITSDGFYIQPKINDIENSIIDPGCSYSKYYHVSRNLTDYSIDSSTCVRSGSGVDLIRTNNVIYCSEATKFGNKIWIAKPRSGFENFPEYATIVQAAVLDVAPKHREFLFGNSTSRYADITLQKSLCCDVPERFSVKIRIWY